MPYFEDDRAVYGHIGYLLRAAAADEALAGRLRDADAVVQYDVRRPDARITAALRSEGDLRVDLGATELRPDVVLTMDGDTAHAYWQGQVNLSVALAKGQIKAFGPVAAILRLVPLSQALFPRYRDLVEGGDLPSLDASVGPTTVDANGQAPAPEGEAEASPPESETSAPQAEASASAAGESSAGEPAAEPAAEPPPADPAQPVIEAEPAPAEPAASVPDDAPSGDEPPPADLAQPVVEPEPAPAETAPAAEAPSAEQQAGDEPAAPASEPSPAEPQAAEDAAAATDEPVATTSPDEPLPADVPADDPEPSAG